MNHLSSHSEYDSNQCYDYESKYEEDIQKAIKRSLKDTKGYDDYDSTEADSPHYVHFNSNGTYFVSIVEPKSPEDYYDPNQILDISLYELKNYINSRNHTSVSSRLPSYHDRTILASSKKAHSDPDDSVSKDLLFDHLLLLFGNDSSRRITDSEIASWCNQGFTNDPNTTAFWGLRQLNNGCCGVLATVQSFMLLSLIFNHTTYGDFSSMFESKEEDESLLMLTELYFNYVTMKYPEFDRDLLYIPSLIEACTYIIYNVTDSSVYHVILYENLPSNKDPLPFLLSKSSYIYKKFQNINLVAEFLVKNFERLTGPLGVVSLVFSALLTRTIEYIKDDMDDPDQPLIVNYGHCTQELVNLLLYGKAVSNVFNGDRVIESDPSKSMKLKGIDSQNTLGFLTDHEAHRLCKVGTFYKNPMVPIWVLCSHNHYTVLFGIDSSGCFFSRSEIVEQNLIEAWSKVDTEENKYIDIKDLSGVLDQLGMLRHLQDALAKLDTSSGIILWTNMLDWYSSKVLGDKDLDDPNTTVILFHYNGKDESEPLTKVTITKNLDFNPESSSSRSSIDASIVGTVSGKEKDISKIVWTRWPRTNVECSTVSIN